MASNDSELMNMFKKMKTDPKMNGLLLRRVIHGYPEQRSGDFSAENVMTILNYLMDAPWRYINGDHDYEIQEIPHEIFSQVLDMLDAYWRILDQQEKESSEK